MSVNNTANPCQEKTLTRRLAPPLAFVFAICLLVICCYDSGYSGLPPTEKRYASAKASITSLKGDEKKSKLREPWEKLAEEFRSIYDTDPAWPNRPAALFRAAESLEELASRSFARSDARKAVECYETLALRHAGSRLADDALFRAARLRAAWLRDDKGALALLARLKKQYPKGDMITEATALEKALTASAKGRTAPDAVAAASRRETQEEPSDASATPKTGSTHATRTDLPLEYRAAKSRMAALRGDPVKVCWRQPWEDLREEFLRISQSSKKQPLAAGALFHAAACQESLARCSNLSADFAQAQKLYLTVVQKHPASSVADDALLAAARLHAGRASGREKALELLERLLTTYPKGDMADEALRLQAALREAAATPHMSHRKAEPPELQLLSWDSPNKNLVEIVLEMSAPARFSTRLVKNTKGIPTRLVLELEDARVINDVRKGVTVRGSLLQAVRVHDRKEGGASLQFDFREVRHFDTHSENDPYRIVLNVAGGKVTLPRKSQKNDHQDYTKAESQGLQTHTAALKARQISNMASQLGLTVRKVFIDAGHGGKDPGTNHNDILERIVTLDVAQRLGRLLEANGLEVAYSRRNNAAVSLSERTRKANAERADLFVSIHVNANENAQINGFETYYLDLASNPQAARVAMLENAGSDRRLGDMQGMLADVMLNARVEESRRLASDIQRLSMFRLRRRDYTVKNNGVKSAPFHVLLGAQMPAILVEIGYCTNREEARNLGKATYRHALAEGLAEGILAYRDRLLNRRTADNSLTTTTSDAM